MRQGSQGSAGENDAVAGGLAVFHRFSDPLDQGHFRFSFLGRILYQIIGYAIIKLPGTHLRSRRKLRQVRGWHNSWNKCQQCAKKQLIKVVFHVYRGCLTKVQLIFATFVFCV